MCSNPDHSLLRTITDSDTNSNALEYADKSAICRILFYVYITLDFHASYLYKIDNKCHINLISESFSVMRRILYFI